MKKNQLRVQLFPLAFVVGSAGLSVAQVREEWVARYDGPAHLSDYANAIAVDDKGNVHVTGSACVTRAPFRQDYATIKYDADGNELWVARYNGPANSLDIALAIALDGAGNVYVTGASGGAGTG